MTNPNPALKNSPGAPLNVEAAQQQLMDATAFYDTLAPLYDAMTSPEKRSIRERPFFSLMVDKYHIHRALDAGAGTGFHSFLLARLGVEVTAVDISPAMLQELQAKARLEHISISCILSDLRSIAGKSPNSFDAVFCMGNTLPHAKSTSDLSLILSEFYSVLSSGGTLFLQLLNYDRITTVKPDVLAATSHGAISFIRSYEYGKHLNESSNSTESAPITFSVQTSVTDDASGSDVRDIIRTELHPITSAGLLSQLEEAGFTDVHFFGSISLEKFQPATSKDLFLIARKP